MDPATVVDLVVAVVAANPKTAGFLAAIPVVQGIAALFARIFPPHTIAARWGTKIAAFPVNVPAKPVPDPANTK